MSLADKVWAKGMRVEGVQMDRISVDDMSVDDIGGDPLSATGQARRRSLRAVLGLASLAGLPWLSACGTWQVVPEGFYRVRRGDTMTQIARHYGRTVEELRRWNQLPDANRIQVGQLLRVSPPETVASRAPGSSSGTSKPAQPGTPQPAAPPGITLVRPAAGRIIEPYGGSARGLTIANRAGTPVVAAAAGSVMYAASGLRAYGNLVIIQHSANYLTIYAHNRKLLVKEGQQVRQGQKIAEMGATGSDQVALYFELRHNGQPVNPTAAFK